MISRLNPLLDWFIPGDIGASETDVPMVRDFVVLHMPDPLMLRQSGSLAPAAKLTIHIPTIEPCPARRMVA